MHSIFTNSRRVVPICYRNLLARLYATNITQEVLQKWRLKGMPAPRSILDDDDSPVDLSEDNAIVDGVNPDAPPIHGRRPSKIPTPSQFVTHRKTMKKDFAEGWNPPRKLSREAMEGLRDLHRADKEKFSTPVLAEKFKISPEAVRRILKSKWTPSVEKRVKQVEKERAGYDEYITLNRVRERIEADRLLALKRSTTGRTTGIDSKDRLTFE